MIINYVQKSLYFSLPNQAVYMGSDPGVDPGQIHMGPG